ncbi:MAG TPA: DUF58 domain-containing protein [Longimicrobiales bacterium]|nr:DUF58 domain-containing protein [Longimicrobiales bacterium]
MTPRRGFGPALRSALASPVRTAGEIWRRLRSWRRIRFTRAGTFFVAGTFAIGFAAINTGNNLLYLLLGAMLGAMAVSGWLSEQTLRSLQITRRVPGGGHVGEAIPIHYRVTNGKGFLATYALELQEPGLPEVAFLAHVAPGASAGARSSQVFLNRGVYPLEQLTLATDYPFGLFRKERDVPVRGEILVWPRIDLRVRLPAGAAGRRQRRSQDSQGSERGARGEYRSLREYRPGDDPRDIHWKATARTGRAVIREFDRAAAEALWVSLDVGTPEGDPAERAADLTASLLARLLRDGSPVALHAGDRVVPPGSGPGQLERVLDALARVEFGSADTAPPVPRDRCVRVTAGSRPVGWADAILARAGAAPDGDGEGAAGGADGGAS